MALSWDPEYVTGYEQIVSSVDVDVPAGTEPWIILICYGSYVTGAAGMDYAYAPFLPIFQQERSALGSTIEVTLSTPDQLSWVAFQSPTPIIGLLDGGTIDEIDQPYEVNTTSGPVMGIATIYEPFQLGIPMVTGDLERASNNIVNTISGSIEAITNVWLSDGNGPFEIDGVDTDSISWSLWQLESPSCIELGIGTSGFYGTYPNYKRISTIGINGNPPTGVVGDCWTITITTSHEIEGMEVSQYYTGNIGGDLLSIAQISPLVWRATGIRAWGSDLEGGISIISHIGLATSPLTLDLEICSGDCTGGAGSWSIVWG
jgi:hypothetical protein